MSVRPVAKWVTRSRGMPGMLGRVDGGNVASR